MSGFKWITSGLFAVICTLLSVFICTPIWLWRSFIRPKTGKGSPNPLQNYLTHCARSFLYWLAAFQAQPSLNTRTPSSLRDTILQRKFVWIEPAKVMKHKNAEKDDLTTVQDANEEMIFDDKDLPIDLEEKEYTKETAGLWFLNPKEEGPIPKDSPRKSPVVLWFHGGAFITLEAGDIFMGLTMSRMHAKYGNCDILSINYRLSPRSKYPSHLFEAFSAWRYLRKLGYEKVIIGGDSAGANLACQLWHYLYTVHKTATSIAGIYLISPWLDMKGYERESFKQKSPYCVLAKLYTEKGFKSIQRANIPDAMEPWISPLHWSQAKISSLPPVLVVNGGIEAILEEAEEFVQLIQSSNGINSASVQHIIFPGHPHDFPAIFWYAGTTKKLFKKSKDWIEETLSSCEHTQKI